MILSNFHTHTTFVDGDHTAEEMVRSALSQGFHTLGFSEHAHTPLDGECSLTSADTMEYRKEIARLQEKYAGQIRLLCGIEMDYTSRDDPAAYDYVIGSVHYLTVKGETYAVDLSPEETLRCVHTAFGGDYDAYAEEYFATVARVADKTHANIIGHFDLLTKYTEKGVGPDETSPRYIAAWQAAMEQLVGKAALELNTGAMSRGLRSRPYPSLAMLQYWHKLGGEVVINSDSHHRDTLRYGFETAVTLANAAGFTTFGFTDHTGEYHRQSGE